MALHEIFFARAERAVAVYSMEWRHRCRGKKQQTTAPTNTPTPSEGYAREECLGTIFQVLRRLGRGAHCNFLDEAFEDPSKATRTNVSRCARFSVFVLIGDDTRTKHRLGFGRRETQDDKEVVTCPIRREACFYDEDDVLSAPCESDGR